MKKNTDAPEEGRSRVIIRTSIIGILANVFLAAFKAVVGLFSHSIAIVLDAVNNLSDAASSLITIVGTKLAGKEADREHPFGYGRIEYLSAMLISGIVLYAGITALIESLKKIIHPDVPEYGAAVLIILAAGVIVKIVLGRYVKATGEKVRSDSLINSGQDAVLDAVISAATLAAAVIYLVSGISLEAWLGAIISLVIIKAGVEMLTDTISKLLGERAGAELAAAIKKTIVSFDGVTGAYDLILHNYGPDAYNGSVHIEVPDTFSAGQLDDLTRAITAAVYEKHGVILTGVGIYAVNTSDPVTIKMREKIREEALQEPGVLQMHGFYRSEEQKFIRFDLVVSFDAPDRAAAVRHVKERIKTLYPGYDVVIAMDADFS